jgi:hypothetical protein
MRFFLPVLLFVAACSPVATVVEEDPGVITEEPIELSMSLYVVDEAGTGGDSALSSDRTASELAQIAGAMRAIWAQAGIDLTVATTTRIEVPAIVLRDLAQGDTSSFFDAASAGAIALPDAGSLLGFYVKRIGPANGLTPLGTRVFFVTDEPSVNDERVSSHEIGHILGLDHTLDDSARLMFSGTNGTELTDEESVVARYGARGILDGVR